MKQSWYDNAVAAALGGIHPMSLSSNGKQWSDYVGTTRCRDLCEIDFDELYEILKYRSKHKRVRGTADVRANALELGYQIETKVLERALQARAVEIFREIGYQIETEVPERGRVDNGIIVGNSRRKPAFDVFRK